jgi:hypothetical protein
MGRKPKYQVFKTTKGQKVNYKTDNIGALWAEENQYGEFFTGKIGGVSVVVYQNRFWTEEADGPNAGGGAPGTDDDCPF